MGGGVIPIVAHIDKVVVNLYGVLLPDGLTLRAHFIISPTCVLCQITVNDLPVGHNIDVIIRLFKAFHDSLIFTALYYIFLLILYYSNTLLNRQTSHFHFSRVFPLSFSLF